MCQTPSMESTQHGCGCGHDHGHGPGVIKPASHDLDFPPVPFPPPDLLSMIGETGLRQLVARHYALIRASEIGNLFPADEPGFAQAIQRSADFVVETCGGPARYSERRGNACMRTRHFPYLIDETARDVWLDCLWRAFDIDDIPIAARRMLWDWLEAMSIRMVNRRTQRSQPPRYPYEAVARMRARTTLAAVCPR